MTYCKRYVRTSWNVTIKIKDERFWRIVQMLRSKVSRKEESSPRRRFISSIKKKFKRKSTSFIRKDLNAIVNGDEAERQEIGLETVVLGNGGRSVLFRLKDTTIFYIHKTYYVCCVPSPWNRCFEQYLLLLLLLQSILIAWYFLFESNEAYLYKIVKD